MEVAMPDTLKPQNEHISQRLQSNLIAWFISVREDGRPHSVPVWFLWDGSYIIVFSQPENQKIKNIRHNPNVALSLDNTGDDGGDVVTIEGTAEILTQQQVALPAIISAYEAKYREEIKDIGMSLDSFAASYSQAIRIVPTKFRG
jgi:PPOX class probable F420-dependent enzyme